jgi:hypothetical protein
VTKIIFGHEQQKNLLRVQEKAGLNMLFLPTISLVQSRDKKTKPTEE